MGTNGEFKFEHLDSKRDGQPELIDRYMHSTGTIVPMVPCCCHGNSGCKWCHQRETASYRMLALTLHRRN